MSATNPPEKPRPLTLKTRLLAGTISGLGRLVSAGVRLRVEGREALEETVKANHGAILVFWHGRSMLAN